MKHSSDKLTFSTFSGVYENVSTFKKYDVGFLLFCLFLLLVLLLVPSFLKFFENKEFILLSSQSYSHLEISEYIYQNGNFPMYNWLSFSGINFKFVSVFEYVLSFISKVTGVSLFFLVLFLPVVFGLAFFVLLHLFLIELKAETSFRRIFLLLFISSPLFIYLFSVSNYVYMPLFLLLLSIVLFISGNIFLKRFSYVLFLLAPFFGYVFLIISILVLILLYLKFKRKTLLFLSIILFCTIFFFVGDIFSILSAWNVSNFLNYSFLLTDFGYYSGFSLFSLSLFVIGLVCVRKRDEAHKPNYFDIQMLFVLFFCIVIFFFLSMDMLFFVNLIVIYYAARGFLYVIRFGFESDLLKYLTIIVVLSISIFIPISYINHLSSLYPDKETVSAFTYLFTLKDYDYSVFSSGKHGALINSIAKMPNVIDDDYFYLTKYRETQVEMNNIYYTRNITLVDNFFQKYNVRYVYIDSDMKKDIWVHDNQGLLFLLETSDRFERIYNTTNVVIYKYRTINNTN